MDDRVRKVVIQELEKPGVLKKLYDYACHRQSFRGVLPAGLSPEDAVHEVITSLLTSSQGGRTWDEERHPDLIVALKGMIKSELSNMCSKEINRSKLLKSRNEEQAVKIDGSGDNSGQLATKGVNDSELAKKIESLIEDDDELYDIYSAIVEGYEKPREIAERLELDEKEIKTRLQRLRRKCRKNIEIKASS